MNSMIIVRHYFNRVSPLPKTSEKGYIVIYASNPLVFGLMMSDFVHLVFSLLHLKMLLVVPTSLQLDSNHKRNKNERNW